MNFKRFILICLLGVSASACSRPEPASLVLMSSSFSIGSEGGAGELSFETNQSWTVSADQSWVSLSPASGPASDLVQTVTVQVQENADAAPREAQLTVRSGELTRTVSVRQAGAPRFTIRDFRNAKPDKTVWYKLTGEIVSQPERSYGNFYLADDTGYIFVYGLCATQVGTNDKSFATLGLTPGDIITIGTLRSEYGNVAQAGGTTPAYLISRTPGDYSLGRKVSATQAGWLELPATSDADGRDLLIHDFPDGGRSYSAYWDHAHLVASWVAYPLHAGNIGTGSRMAESHFPMDPLLEPEQQPYLSKSYQPSGSYNRGHQIPSADRLDWRVNLETFFSTNMTPQDGELNSGAWEALERKVRDWARHADTDTLYVVSGCSVAGSTATVEDNAGKKVTVPTGYYKALLRLDKTGGYSGAAFWLDNKPDRSGSIRKEMSMSIDALEEKLGIDLFVNLPDAVQERVEAQDPAGEAWWWNN